jgi:DNA modification methylase
MERSTMALDDPDRFGDLSLPRQLALVEQALLALAEARTIGEVKEIRDKAEVIRHYLKLKAASLEAENVAAEIKAWAERKAGELLASTPRNPGGRPPKNPRHDDGGFPDPPPTLEELGIDENESRRWQAMAEIPEADFRLYIAETKAAGKELSSSGILGLAKGRKAEERRDQRRADLMTKAQDVPPSDRWQVIHGDCLPLMRAMKPGSARLVFADPPYNEGVDYGDGPGGDRLPSDAYLQWTEEWMAEAKRILAPDGSMWVLISEDWADDFGVILRRRLGLKRRRWIGWFESFGVNCSNNFGRCLRHLFYMAKDARPGGHVFHRGAVLRESDRQAKYNDRRANPEGKILDNLWTFPRVAGTHGERIPDFPTQLPVDMLTSIVGCATDPGDLVVDPFSGSGTTGEACVRLGRRYLGYEKNGRFCEVSRLRLAAASKEVNDGGI